MDGKGKQSVLKIYNYFMQHWMNQKMHFLVFYKVQNFVVGFLILDKTMLRMLVVPLAQLKIKWVSPVTAANMMIFYEHKIC